MFRTTVAIAILLASTASVAQMTDLAAAFGARPQVESASLSPDGKKIAMIVAGPGSSDILQILDTSGAVPLKRAMTATGKPERLGSCLWVGNDRLACNIYVTQLYNGDFYGAKSVMALDYDGNNAKLLSKRAGENRLYADWRGGGIIDLLPGEEGKVLMQRVYVPEANVNSVIAKTTEGMGVDRIDTRSGQSTKVEAPRRDANEFITDGRGNVRIMGSPEYDGKGYPKGTIKYLYRPASGGGWLPLSIYDTQHETGFNPYAVDPDKNVAYGFEPIDGRQALVSVDLGGSGQHTTLVTNPRVDVDSLITIGRNRRVVGASFETETRDNVYFDPSIKATTTALSKALGGKSAWVTDSSADESKLLIWSGSDVDPGQYYLFDKTAKKLTPITPDRPQLASIKLADVRPISYPAADGTMIPAYLTLPPGSSGKNLPAIVLPHGGPEARDYYGFDWLSQYYAARGFAVIQPNFRGSAGYGQAWLAQNGWRSWKLSVGDVVDAGKYLVAQGIADPAKLTVMGWSYGGYAALQSNVLAPGLFKAVVAVAPVTDMGALIAVRREYGDYYLLKEYVGTGPHIVQGSPAQNAAAFQAPVLMFHGTMDSNVRIEQSKLMDAKLKGAGKRSELVIFDGLNHQLDDSTARATLLQRSADFLLAAGK